MRLAAFIGLKDEADLIGPCIAQLKRSGADSVTVVDEGSQDGGREIVQRLAAEDPSIRLADISLSDIQAGLSRDGPVLGHALQELDPDWLLFTDADEFWLSRSGNLKRLPELANYDLLIVNRFNVPLTEPPIDIAAYLSDGRSGELPLIVQREVLSRDAMKSEPDKRWVMHAIGPKIMCRASSFGGLSIGAHKVIPREGRAMRPTVSKNVVIAHMPFSSFERFERKVENIRGVFERYDEQFSGPRGWHWRRWLELADQNLLRAEFEAQQMAPFEIETLYAAGTIRTTADLFSDRIEVGANAGGGHASGTA